MSKNIINVDSLKKYHDGLKVTYFDPLNKKFDDFISGDAFLNELEDFKTTFNELFYEYKIETDLYFDLIINNLKNNIANTVNTSVSNMENSVNSKLEEVDNRITELQNFESQFERNIAKLQAQIDELKKAIENGVGNVNLENYATKEFVTNEINKVAPSLVPRFTIGNVVTLEPNQQATVILRGTVKNPILDFGIPRGRDGLNGGTNIENNIVGSAKVGFVRITL